MINKYNPILLLFLLALTGLSVCAQDTLLFKGQFSAFTHYNPKNDLPLLMGVRYIPQLNYSLPQKKDKLIDFEASLNIYGNIASHPFSSDSMDGNIKPYRLWARYSSRQFELRLGLQKINFGSASMIRPLMWFDQLDPRDPLQLTDGVWGLLGRYYFLNNANIWLWGLYGNEKPKTWEIGKTSQKFPEFGGRFQTPVPRGEAAVSYHFRTSDVSELDSTYETFIEVPENRLGLDAKWDLGIGLWFEGAWFNKARKTGIYTNEEIVNCGIDYTFAIGNGLSLIYEQLVFSYDEVPFAFLNTLVFSGLSATYPVGMFDMLTGIVFYDWTNKSFYNFINWKKQFNNISLYFMAYWNPKKYYMPQQSEGSQIFAGKGIQFMFVFNH